MVQRPTLKPRVPDHIRDMLAVLLERLERGPHWSTIGPPKTAEDVRHEERCWRDDTTTSVRQILAWADGVESATDIKVYHAGMGYVPAVPSESLRRACMVAVDGGSASERRGDPLSVANAVLFEHKFQPATSEVWLDGRLQIVTADGHRVDAWPKWKGPPP